MAERVFTFGPFELRLTERLLLERNRPIRLGGRAFDVLVALVERAGEVVGKDELIARVWPGVTVEETNLRVHVAALRAALGDGRPGLRYVMNVPGRGYCLVVPVTARSNEQRSAPPATVRPPQRASNLPPPLTRTVGRAEEIGALVGQLPWRRLVTVTGPGGIGKTTVVLAAAELLSSSYADGAVFVELAPITNAALVPGALSTALGLGVRAEDPTAALAAYVRDKALLIVLDGCEHVIEAAAGLVEALLKAGPRVGILTSSREALRAEAEWVQRLPPLDLPPDSTGITAPEAMRFPAVQLFCERTSARLGGFELNDADAPFVTKICRRLDGIALAIELAAGRMDTFSPQALASLLDDRFSILTRGRRTALRHHQTLRAALDWSYSALPDPDQATLRRLSVFNTGFTLAAARAVAAGGGIATEEIEDRVAELVAKSLLAVEFGETEVHYRLLETTRVYANEKLTEADELGGTVRRHAAYMRQLFERAQAEWDTRLTTEWLTIYSRSIDDLRAALNWAFSADGDGELGVALTLASVPLWSQLSMVDECLGWVERALIAFEAAPGQDQRRRMQLHAALGWPQMYASGRIESGADAWRTTLRLAEELGDADYQLRALWALWADRTNHGEFREALALADRFRELVAEGGVDPTGAADHLVGERMTGTSLHFLGRQLEAREHIERVITRYVAPARRSHAVRFQFDQRVTARMTLARVLWVQGFPDQAMREVEANVADAQSLGHALSLCNLLAQAAAPVSLLAGDLMAAARFSAMLRRHTADHALDVWRAYADCFEGEVSFRRGSLAAAFDLLVPAVDELQRRGFVQYITSFLATLAQALAEAGRTDEGQAAVNKALHRCVETGEAWCLAELLRIRGEMVMRRQGPRSWQAAEIDFDESLRIARDQGALGWELRTATSLAALRIAQHREREGLDQLRKVYARFGEGFATPDLLRASAILQAASRGAPP